jgi:REP element-mobilizing transposase RayT
MLDEWIVMPNHFHGIICIVEPPVETTRRVVSNKPCESGAFVETHCYASLQRKNIFGPQKNNLSSIIRGFKSITTKRIHTNGYPDFSWQPRFYDHIIRDEKGLNAIREYIHNNPAQWEYDRNDPSGLYNWKQNDHRLQRRHIN